MATRDIVYDPVGQRIYASVPSSAPNGNSLTQIDPFAGTVGSSVVMGNEPGRLAISDNSQYIYAALDATGEVRRFDLASQTAGPQYPVGSDGTFGTHYVADLAVLPGQPDSVAISKKYLSVSSSHAGVAIYDNGLPRPNMLFRNDQVNFIEFSTSATTLYGYNAETTEFGLRKMTVNGSGLTVTSITRNLVSGFGVDIVFANGLLYTTNGRAVNPETATPVGTFPGVGFGASVLPDPGANRIYFLTGSGSSTLVLKAFDLTTFIQTGSVSINGVSGNPSRLIKWADDGLAFRTSGNQIFLLSTADIVPINPTATPTPVTVAAGVTRLSLATNDIVYDPNTQKVFASLPSSAGTFGNSISGINPQTGEMGNPVFIGSEPRKLAISDNRQYIYAGLDGAASVRRFDVPSQVPGLQFALGPIQFNGPMTIDDLAVLPGSPNSIAIARGNTNPPFDSVAVFDDGVARGFAAMSGRAIEFSTLASTLYAYGEGISFNKLAVSASGVSVVSTVGQLITGPADIRYDTGRIYTTTGRVIDPEAAVLLGTFSGASGLVVPDSGAGQIYYLTGLGSSNLTLKSYDPNTFTPTGTLNISGVTGTPGSFIKAGANLLAFRTESQVYFVAISAITPIAPTPTPTPIQVASGIIQLPLPANDLVYDPNTQKVYASVPSSAGSFGNSLVPIDPVTGTMGTPIFLGSEPRKLAISSDRQFIYAGLDGIGAVRRFDLASHTAGLQFSLGSGQFSGPRFVDDMEVVPGDANAVAVARRNSFSSPRFEGVAIYDSGVERPTAIQNNNLTEVIEFSVLPSTLYGFNNETTGFDYRKMLVNPSGVSIVSNLAGALSGFGIDIKYDNGNIYASTGRVINAESGAVVGTFSGASSPAFVPDASVKRTYFIAGTGGPTTLQAFDQNTFLAVGSLSVPGVNGTPLKLIRWGTNGLAFNTSGGQIYFVQTPLVPPASVSPSVTTVGSSANPINFGQTVTFTATVSSAAGTPTGTVQFRANGLNIGSPQPMTGGVATFATSALGAGSHLITALYSGDSNFLVSGGTLAGAQAVLPALSINDVSLPESSSGTPMMTFTVTLSSASNQAVAVNYATADGTATLTDNDYQAASGTITFNPGTLTRTVAVLVRGDLKFEPNETFVLNLTNPVNATISDGQAVGTIVNDDTLELMLDPSGPDANQLMALESILFVRDPFRVRRIAEWLQLGPDQNTRLIIFAANLNPGTTPASVVVNLIDGNGQSYDVPAERLSTLTNTPFTQVIFRLPDNLAAGTCLLTLRAPQGRISNTGTFRIVS